MRKILILFSILVTAYSCKQNQENKVTKKELTIAEKIAKAHGHDNWKAVSELHFTFNVDTDSTHFERSWIWIPKTGDVTLILDNDTISYNRKTVDSTSIIADKNFINDKFWLLAPILHGFGF